MIVYFGVENIVDILVHFDHHLYEQNVLLVDL